jgi:pimeloyl-ACP methyl ester carboxylesterase
MKSDPEIGFWRTDYHTVNGFRQFYRDWRPREESCLPVLALHGSLTQSGMWVAPAEAAGTVRMLCPDQRGFGRSEDPGSDSCAEFASDALALAQYLLPERYVVMAHSFACSIALAAAHGAASNVAAVVLVEPVVRVRPPLRPPRLLRPQRNSARSKTQGATSGTRRKASGPKTRYGVSSKTS